MTEKQQNKFLNSFLYHFQQKYAANRFCDIANFVVISRLRFGVNIILLENKLLRSSQPRKA